jgi:arginyl-tRNA synthetase
VIKKINTEGKTPKEIGERGAKIILDKFIKPETKNWGIRFDTWFLESNLYKKKEREQVLSLLKKKKLIFEKDGATWFKATEFGDDKNRVLKRSDNKDTYSSETYFLSEILYVRNKFKRGFDFLIIFLGAEHHGYVKRLKAAAKALGYNQDRVKPIIMQHVRILDEGRQVKMSKRKGIFVTLEDLTKEVGLDAARFFFLTRSYNNHLIFDLDLAKEQSEKNPVYYIQYAHTRICSIIKKSKQRKVTTKNFNLLNHQSELKLIKKMIQFPEVIEDVAKNYQVQRIPQYAVDLATSFHQFYRDCQVLSKDRELTKVRLGLVSAVRITLGNTLNLMGISAPEKM